MRVLQALCGVLVYIAASPARAQAEAPAPPPSAAEVLRRMGEAYDALDSYSDSHRVPDDVSIGWQIGTLEFARGKGYRLERSGQGGAIQRRLTRCAAWGEGGEHSSYVAYYRKPLRLHDSASDALIAAGLIGGGADAIPMSELDPDVAVLGRVSDEAIGAGDAVAERIGPTDCWRIETTERFGDARLTLWVGKDDGLVRKAEEWSPVRGGAPEVVTVFFTPTANPKFDDGHFRGDPPGLPEGLQAVPARTPPAPPPAPAPIEGLPSPGDALSSMRAAHRGVQAYEAMCLVTEGDRPSRVSRVVFVDGRWRVDVAPYHPAPDRRDSMRFTAWRDASDVRIRRFGADGPKDEQAASAHGALRHDGGLSADAFEAELLGLLEGGPAVFLMSALEGLPVALEVIDGVECLKFNAGHSPDSSPDIATTVWIGREDGLIRQMESSLSSSRSSSAARARFWPVAGAAIDAERLAPPEGPPPGLDVRPEWRTEAQRLMDLVRERYATCATYRDAAQLSAGGETLRLVRTLFRRDDRFRLELVRPHVLPTVQRANRTIGWRSGDSGGLYDKGEERLFEGAALNEELALESSWLPLMAAIPSLLHPSDEHWDMMMFVEAVAVEGEDVVEGTPCVRVRMAALREEGAEPRPQQVLWVGKEDHLIRKAAWRWKEEPGQYVYTLLIRPRIGVELGDELFQKDPPGLTPLGEKKREAVR